MPKPKKTEAKTDYLKRCTQQLVDREARNPKEAYAVCNSMWDKARGEASLTLSAPVDLTLEDRDSGRRSFLITAKTRAPLTVWGEVVHIDIAGIATPEKLPILREHDRKAIVGTGSAYKEDHTLFIEGEFSKTTLDAEQVQKLADEGYPWQASIGMWGGKIEYLETEKDKTTVNGASVKGPAVIVRESTVREVSFVTLGADDKTAAIALSSECCGDETLLEEDPIMLTMDELKSQHPELVKELEAAAFSRGFDDGRKDGVTAERARCLEIMESEADFALILTAVKDGTPATDAYKAFYLAEKEKRAAALKEMAASAPPSVGAEPPREPDVKPVKSAEAKLAEKTVKVTSGAVEAGFAAALKEDPALAADYLKSFEPPTR